MTVEDARQALLEARPSVPVDEIEALIHAIVEEQMVIKIEAKKANFADKV